MAEFKLSYTANEINEKLGMIAQKADKSEIPSDWHINDLINTKINTYSRQHDEKMLMTVTETTPVDTASINDIDAEQIYESSFDTTYRVYKVSDRCPSAEDLANGFSCYCSSFDYTYTFTANDLYENGDTKYVDDIGGNGMCVYFVPTRYNRLDSGTYICYRYDEFGYMEYPILESVTVPRFVFKEKTAEVEKVKESMIPSNFATKEYVDNATQEVPEIPVVTEIVTDSVTIDTITSDRFSSNVNRVSPPYLDYLAAYGVGYCWRVSNRVPPKSTIEKGVEWISTSGNTGTSYAVQLSGGIGSENADIYHLNDSILNVYFVYSDDIDSNWGGTGTYFFYTGSDDSGMSRDYITSLTIPGFAFDEETTEVEKIKESLIPSKFMTRDEVEELIRSILAESN